MVILYNKLGHALFTLLPKMDFAFCGTGVWLRESRLQAGTHHWNHTSSLFCSGCFGDKVLLFPQAGLDCNPPIYAPLSSWDARCTPPYQAFSVKMGCCEHLPGLALNHDLPHQPPE
jgi:hypothetical protein